MKLTSTIIAIDPGWTGAIIIADEIEDLSLVDKPPTVRKPFKVLKCPKTVEGMAEIFKNLDQVPHIVYIERVHTGMFSKISNFRLGENYGNWCGVLAGLGIPFQTVTPQAWQKSYQPKRVKGKKRPASFDIKRVVWKEMKKLYPKMLGKKYRPCESHTADALGILTNSR